MSDREVFERRLAQALRRYAAEAEEDIDPVAVAHLAVAENARPKTWPERLGRRPRLLTRPVPVLVLTGVLVAVIVASIQLLPQQLYRPAASLPSSPAPAVGTGAAHVTGTETQTQLNAGTQASGAVRDRILTTTDAADDARVSGTGTLQISIDYHGTVGSVWGTYRLENAGGAWQGSVTGATDTGGTYSDIWGWLAGSGAYEGYTYYFHADGSGALKFDGIIYPGPAPVGTAPAGSNPTGSPAAS
jgi:hypothetical protein